MSFNPQEHFFQLIIYPFFSHSEILEIIDGLPDDLQHLYLNDNEFYNYHPLELKEIIASLPQKLPSLNLASNRLAKIHALDLAQMFQMLPITLLNLSLMDNDLSSLNSMDLKYVFKHLPKSLVALDLSTNRLSELMFSQAASSLPPGLNRLQLQYNLLGSASTHLLIQSIKQLSSSLLMLNLSYNKLEYCDLISLFAEFPASLTVLDLSGNHLYQKPKKELALALSSISAHLEYLYLCENKLDSTWLFSILPLHFEHVICDDQSYPGHANFILQVMYTSLPQNEYEYGSHKNWLYIQTHVEIHQDNIADLIEHIEQKPSSIADFTCAHLLLGAIENTLSQNLIENNAYLEKRFHDAIHYYLKAAADPILRPVVKFCLWQMSLVCNFSSIEYRLSQLERGIHPIIDRSRFKSEKDVMLPFYRSI